MSYLKIHDKVCEACLEISGKLHETGPSYNTRTKEWTVITWSFTACPLWGTEKAVHRWKRKQRRSPMILNRNHVPKGCICALEHLLIEETE